MTNRREISASADCDQSHDLQPHPYAAEMLGDPRAHSCDRGGGGRYPRSTTASLAYGDAPVVPAGPEEMLAGFYEG
jgi:hypothetical protein